MPASLELEIFHAALTNSHRTIIMGAFRMSGIFTNAFADFTHAATQTSIWSVSEMGTAIVVASSPITRPIFDKIFQSIRLLGSNRNPYTDTGSTPKNRNADFGRLHDELPLKNIVSQPATVTNITAESRGPEESLDNYHTYSRSTNASNMGKSEDDDRVSIRLQNYS